MKKILFVTPFNPEKKDSGENIYSWDVIRSLIYDKTNRVHVVTYLDSAKEKKSDYSILETIVEKVTYVPFKYKNILQIGLSLYPAMIANRKTPQMISTVQKLLNEDHYDAIVVNHPRLEYLIEYIRDFKGKKLFISHNVEHKVSQSTYIYSDKIGVKIAYFFDYIKTKYWERRFLRQYDAVSAICDVDCIVFQEFLKKKDVFLLPPIVECDPIPQNWHPSETNKLIVCGSFTWTPKTINLRKLLNTPSIFEIEKNGFELMIIGRAPKAEIEKGNTINGVYVSGEVDSVTPYYAEATVALIPELVGGGFKLKIAEAVQHNLPIVAIKGAVTDLEMKNGVHYIEVNTFDDLFLASLKLMKDINKREELVRNANSLFRERYSISKNSNRFNNYI